MFGVGKFAITWLWCNNQAMVQSLGYFGEGGGRLGFVVVLYGHAHQRRVLNITWLCLALAFFDCGGLMHRSYIKSSKRCEE